MAYANYNIHSIFLQAIDEKDWTTVTSICNNKQLRHIVVNSTPGGYTPAMRAVWYYEAPEHVVVNMIEHMTKESLECIDPEVGNTILHLSAEHAYPTAVKRVLQVTDEHINWKDEWEKTPLDYCLESKGSKDQQKETVICLLSYGASCSQKDNEKLRQILKGPEPVSTNNEGPVKSELPRRNPITNLSIVPRIRRRDFKGVKQNKDAISPLVMAGFEGVEEITEGTEAIIIKGPEPVSTNNEGQVKNKLPWRDPITNLSITQFAMPGYDEELEEITEGPEHIIIKGPKPVSTNNEGPVKSELPRQNPITNLSIIPRIRRRDFEGVKQSKDGIEPISTNNEGTVKNKLPWRDPITNLSITPLAMPGYDEELEDITEELSEERFRQLIVDVSSWWKRHGKLTMLKVLLFEFKNISVTDIEKATNPIDLFKLLEGSGLISQSNIEILIEALMLGGLQGVEPKIKKLVPDFEGFSNTVIHKFSKHRQNLIRFGQMVSNDNMTIIGHLCDMNIDLPDPWVLIFELEKMSMLTGDRMMRFIKQLEENGMNDEAATLKNL